MAAGWCALTLRTRDASGFGHRSWRRVRRARCVGVVYIVVVSVGIARGFSATYLEAIVSCRGQRRCRSGETFKAGKPALSFRNRWPERFPDFTSRNACIYKVFRHTEAVGDYLTVRLLNTLVQT